MSVRVFVCVCLCVCVCAHRDCVQTYAYAHCACTRTCLVPALRYRRYASVVSSYAVEPPRPVVRSRTTSSRLAKPDCRVPSCAAGCRHQTASSPSSSIGGPELALPVCVGGQHGRAHRGFRQGRRICCCHVPLYFPAETRVLQKAYKTSESQTRIRHKQPKQLFNYAYAVRRTRSMAVSTVLTGP